MTVLGHVVAGDCWFVAAVACLAVGPEQLFHRVVPLDQSFDQTSYAGTQARVRVFQFSRPVLMVAVMLHSYSVASVCLSVCLRRYVLWLNGAS